MLVFAVDCFMPHSYYFVLKLIFLLVLLNETLYEIIRIWYLNSFILWHLCALGFVLHNVKKLDALGKDVFRTATFLQMGSPLMVHGTCKNPFTWSGNNGIAKMIVVTIAWWTEKKKENQMVMDLSSIMENGPSHEFMGFRFAHLHPFCLSKNLWVILRWL